jgi:hypothetical protein
LLSAAISLLLTLVLSTVASAAGRPPTKGQVQGRLLTVSEMPVGWSVDNTVPSGGPTVFPCLANFAPPKGERFISASIQFQEGPVPVFAEKLTTDGSTASAVFASAVKALDRCRSVTLSGLHGSIGRLSFPHVGNASAAYAARFTYDATPAGLDLVIFRSGIYEGLLVYIDAGTPKVPAVEGLVRSAVAKVAAKALPTAAPPPP